MPSYGWKRVISKCNCPDEDSCVGCVEMEYATTNSPDKLPEGDGWRRAYSVGIGSVPGAGGSPARPIRSRDASSG